MDHQFIELESNVQTKHDAIVGQGKEKAPFEARGLNRKKTENPNEKSNEDSKKNIEPKIGLYARVITPAEMQVGRVVYQLEESESKKPISSQLNNKINPTMDNMSIRGGTREKL